MPGARRPRQPTFDTTNKLLCEVTRFEEYPKAQGSYERGLRDYDRDVKLRTVAKLRDAYYAEKAAKAAMRGAGVDGRKTQINFGVYFKRMRDQKKRKRERKKAKREDKGLKKRIVKKF